MPRFLVSHCRAATDKCSHPYSTTPLPQRIQQPPALFWQANASWDRKPHRCLSLERTEAHPGVNRHLVTTTPGVIGTRAESQQLAHLTGGEVVRMAVLLAPLLAGCTRGGENRSAERTTVPASSQVLVQASATHTPPAIAPPTAILTVPAPTSTTHLPTVTIPTLTATAPPVASPSMTPTANRHPLFPYTIEGLQARDEGGGMIRIRAPAEERDAFTRYFIEYPSDGLTITGSLQMPRDEGPFPTIILLHGYWPRAQ